MTLKIKDEKSKEIKGQERGVHFAGGIRAMEMEAISRGADLPVRWAMAAGCNVSGR